MDQVEWLVNDLIIFLLGIRLVNKQKKVCFIMGSHWSVVMGGAQYQAKCIMEQIIPKPDFKVFYMARVVDKSLNPKDYKILQIAENKGIRRYGYVFDTFRLNNLLREIDPDVIYQRGLKAYTGILARYAQQNGCKFIFHIAHDYDVIPSKRLSLHWVLGGIEKIIGEYGLRRADYVIAQTKQQCKYLIQNYNRKDAILVPNFHPVPQEDIVKPTRPIRVVWVANFKSMKRPEMFVRLAKDLKNYNEVEFIMIGRQGSKKLYGDMHEEISNVKNIRYLGELPIGQVNKILAESHIFVNTSLAEGFPNTFIQAWMRQVPVVSISVNTDEVLDGVNTGIYGGTYEGMKAAVKNLINDNVFRNTMGQNAQAYAFENHSTVNVNKIIKLIEN